LPAERDQETYELDFRRELLPVPLSDFAGLRLTGHNRSDDLAMLVTVPLRGLLPATVYRVELEADLASNMPYGCASIGGSPGDSVYVKLGASGQEPVADVDWELKTVTTEGQSLLVSSGADGALWIFAGTDSAFEGLTQYYIVSLTVRIEP